MTEMWNRLSNYPPGVTGNEWQIAGLDTDPPESCEDCGYELSEDEAPDYGDAVRCPKCETLIEWLSDEQERERAAEIEADQAYDGRNDP